MKNDAPTISHPIGNWHPAPISVSRPWLSREAVGPPLLPSRSESAGRQIAAHLDAMPRRNRKSAVAFALSAAAQTLNVRCLVTGRGPMPCNRGMTSVVPWSFYIFSSGGSLDELRMANFKSQGLEPAVLIAGTRRGNGRVTQGVGILWPWPCRGNTSRGRLGKWL